MASRLRDAAFRAAMRLPEPLVSAVCGRAPVVVDGQTLDRQVQLLLRLKRLVAGRETYECTVAEARADMEDLAPVLARRVFGVASADRTLPGPAGERPARVYWPPEATGPLPGLLYLHGGGWVTGGLESYDPVCRAFAADAGCAVVALDYRLAPEHPFPAAVDDAVAAFRWLAERGDALGLDPARVAVGGDSAGGCLAAVAARSGGPLPAFQMLIYPATDLSREAASFETFAEGFLLPAESVRWYYRHYLPDLPRRSDVRASPLLAEDLSGLPPALVQVAGYDPLRDEGLAYAERLAAAGVPTETKVYAGLPHGYLALTGAVRAAGAAFGDAAAALRRALSRPAPASARSAGAAPPG